MWADPPELLMKTHARPSARPSAFARRSPLQQRSSASLAHADAASASVAVITRWPDADAAASGVVLKLGTMAVCADSILLVTVDLA